MLALLVACVGLYGVLSYGVTRRTNEIGVRVALGARPSTVVSMVLRETAALVTIGLAVGTALAIAVNRFAQSFLFGVEPNDPRVLTAAALTLTAVSALASLLPARRAAQVDPLVALRHE